MMLQRMKENIASRHLRDALIIGQNLFYHNPGDVDIFSTYYTVLWSLATEANGSTEKLQYFKQLTQVVASFSEAVQLDDEMVEYIKSKEDSLNLLYKSIEEVKAEEEKQFVKSKFLQNDKVLRTIQERISELSVVKSKAEFDSLLNTIQKLDAMLDKQYMSDSENAQYEVLTTKCSELVNIKVAAFDRQSKEEYNQRALDSYEKVYRLFRDGNLPGNHTEVVSGLFAYDPTKLFNETLTYYNHVYSYVLSKLNDEEKYVLTKAAIHCEKRG